jgi:hypothetical protein
MKMPSFFGITERDRQAKLMLVVTPFGEADQKVEHGAAITLSGMKPLRA